MKISKPNSSFIKQFTKKENVAFLLLLVVYVIFQYQKLLLDFWNDELYTMIHFIFVSPLTTVSDYHVPNNHIFFNLTAKFWTTISGIHSIYQLMDTPWKLRLLPFFFSVLSILFVWKTGKQFFSNQIALLAVGFFITCIPFLNYCLQIRGYGLSIMLVILIIYSSHSFIQSKKRNSLLLIALFSMLLMYTIPSNMFFLASLCLLNSFLFFLDIEYATFKTKFFSTIFGNDYFKMNLAIVAGIMVCTLFYLPIFRQVFFNEYVVAQVSTNFETGIHNFIQCNIYFISNRYFVMVLAVIGIVIYFIKKCKLPFVSQGFYLLFLCLFPFVISLLRKDNPPDRIYTNTLPLLSLALAIFVNTTIETIFKHKLIQFVCTLFILAGSIFICFNEQKKIEAHLKHDLVNGDRSQDLYYNYFLSHYIPLKTATQLSQIAQTKKVIVLINDAEPHDIPYYLQKCKVPFYEASSLDSILNTHPQEFYIITRFPDITKKEYAEKNIPYSFEKINTEYSYHNIIRLRKK